MREFLGSLAILAIIIFAGLYFAGWLTYEQSDSAATIEIKTKAIQEAADHAVAEGEAIIDSATQQAAQNDSEATSHDATVEKVEIALPQNREHSTDQNRVIRHTTDAEHPVTTTSPE
jgi:hypothetical protein